MTMQIIAAIERARQAKLLRGTCQSASLRTVLRTDRMMLPLHLADTAVQRTAALRGHSKVAHYASNSYAVWLMQGKAHYLANPLSDGSSFKHADIRPHAG